MYRVIVVVFIFNIVLALCFLKFSAICSYYYGGAFSSPTQTILTTVMIPLYWVWGLFVALLFVPSGLVSAIKRGEFEACFIIFVSLAIVGSLVYALVKTQSRKAQIVLLLILTSLLNVFFLFMACGVMSL